MELIVRKLEEALCFVIGVDIRFGHFALRSQLLLTARIGNVTPLYRLPVIGLSAVMFCFTLFTDSAIAETGGPRAGAQLAQRWCASCHVVAPEQLGTSSDAVPTFAAIAAKPQTSEASLKAFIQTPHPRMPETAIGGRDLDDLVAYILSLRKR